MPLDPQVQGLLSMLAGEAELEMTDATIAEVRTTFAAFAGLGVGDPPPIGAVTDADADGVPVRIYTPAGAATAGELRPVIVYYHGGGWAIGDVAGYDPLTRLLAAETDAIVVSVDYRLAPEHPHPAAVDDSFTALQWVAKHAPDFGADGTRVAVAGDSAGGNLSAVMALLAKARGGPKLALQALVYPVTDCVFDTPSYLENGEGYFLEGTSMAYFFDAYCRGGTDPTTPNVSPLRADDLTGVAPALVITAEFDPLRDEGEAYAAALRAAGVPVEATRYDGMIHGFVAMPALLAGGRQAFDQLVTALRSALGSV
jgi:acetyl esterase